MTLAELIKQKDLNTDKNSDHSYCDYFYDEKFLKYKDIPTTLIEIGTFRGGSALLWNEYFTNKTIYTIDVRKVIILQDYPDIKFFRENAYNKQFVDTLPNYDIFIDDGPHTLESQILAIDLYLPKMNKNGIFVIEDIQDYSHFHVLDSFAKTKGNYTCDFIDLRIIKNRYDDLMFIIYG
jgi:cephalosporin hydroxylase